MKRTIRSLLVGVSAVALLLLPQAAHASTVDTAAQPPVPGAEPFENGWAVPLSTDGPAWFDAAYAQQVLAAGDEGMRLPAGVEDPAAAGLVLPGIRPGQWLVTIFSDAKHGTGFAWCTANFVFTRSGAMGLGTAGHCAAKDALGDFPDVTAYVNPPVGSGKLPGFYHIGKFVLSHNNGIGDDFAMVKLYPQYNSWVSPTMPVWGGPRGVYTSNSPTVVEHFGHGLVVGTGGTPRAGVAPIWDARNGNAFAWYGVGMEGDSGSGVLAATGEAAGNFTHIVILDGVPGEILPGMLAGTRMTKILEIASGWTLVDGGLVGVP